MIELDSVITGGIGVIITLDSVALEEVRMTITSVIEGVGVIATLDSVALEGVGVIATLDSVTLEGVGVTITLDSVIDGVGVRSDDRVKEILTVPPGGKGGGIGG